MNILLVYPATPPTFWSFTHVLPFISKKAAFPPLGLLTVAAMLPNDWNLQLIDLNVMALSDAHIDWADYVMVSGMIVHADSARNIIQQAAARSKPVIAGGPLFITGHERFPEVHHFVLAEAEEIMAEFVADMNIGALKRYYRSSRRPDLTHSPIPRWDLIHPKDYATMSVQFSRGCPFNCDFCDIIVMNGRVPRVKTSEQMIAELESLAASGWKGPVFFVDDNFIGNKAKVKVFLRELIAKQRSAHLRFRFLTQASLNIVDDLELMDLMVEAGFKSLFIGIESPSEDSLVECAKAQNTKRDLVSAVRIIHNKGMEVMGGFIVGFDSDKPSIFERQLQFIQEAGVVTAMVGLLTALPETRLFARLKAEGRILSHSTGNNLDAILNFVPRLDRKMLIDGYRELVRQLYTPRAYYRRIISFLKEYHPAGPSARLCRSDVKAFLRSLWVMGVARKGRREYWKFVLRSFVFHRQAFVEAMRLAITGFHFRRIAGLI
ncbi:MAG: B12-binding domain-containing radical SAM protein [Planctomycetes bacterium]|nr:B12-binding domain-containing radical SAM protein [Planctomycetota bacterium]